MFFSVNSRRAIWSMVFVIGSLSVLSGCKSVYRGYGAESSDHGPYQPYSGEPPLNTPALHEPLPELSPVPPLPGAGHSVPPEPLPSPVPPAPAEASRPQSETVEPDAQPVSQSKSFWSRFSARATSGSSIPSGPLPKVRPGRHAAIASSPVSNLATLIGGTPSIFGTNAMAQGIDGTPPGGFHASDNFAGLMKSQPVETVSSPAVRSGLALPALGSSLSKADAIGPMITPLQEPNSTSGGVIEAWPYRSQPATIPGFVQKNASPPPLQGLPVAPSNETPFGSLKPAPAAVQDQATVPSLLPPGS